MCAEQVVDNLTGLTGSVHASPAGPLVLVCFQKELARQFQIFDRGQSTCALNSNLLLAYLACDPPPEGVWAWWFLHLQFCMIPCGAVLYQSTAERGLTLSRSCHCWQCWFTACLNGHGTILIMFARWLSRSKPTVS